MKTIGLLNWSTLSKKWILCIISVVLLIVVYGLILPTDAYPSSVNNVKPNKVEIKQPVKPKKINKKIVIKPSSKPFLQIKKVYVFPKDNTLRVVIHNTGGGSLKPRDYRIGKLEITIPGTSTKWIWPLIKVNKKKDHFISETTFNTNKVLTETTRIMVRIRGVKAQKPWRGNLRVNKKVKKKVSEVKIVRPVQKPIVKADMVTKMIDSGSPGKAKFFIRNPAPGQRINREEPQNISLVIPDEFVNRDGSLNVVFKVELISTGEMLNVHVADINAAVYSYNSSLNLCNIPWTISPGISDGENYKLQVIARPSESSVHGGGHSGVFTMRGPFSIYTDDSMDDKLRILSPSPGSRVRYDEPLHISWAIPNAFDNGDGQPSATFKVELIKDGRVKAQIDTTRYTYNASSNICSLLWAITSDIEGGSGYKIKVTLRPINQYEHGGNAAAIMPEGFEIDTFSSRGTSNGFRLYSPSSGQRYAIGDSIKVIYSWAPDPANANQAGHTPQMVKIMLTRKSPAGGGGVQEWIEFVPALTEMSIIGGVAYPTMSVYVNTITIPARTYRPGTGTGHRKLIPGTYSISIRDADGRYWHLSGGSSGHFTIYDDKEKHIDGIRDGLINDPFEIVSPGASIETWNKEKEQTVEWKFDPDLSDVDWHVYVDMRINAGGYYKAPSDDIQVSAKGTASIRFKLPKSFWVGTTGTPYAKIIVKGVIQSGSNSNNQIETHRTVKMKKTIEMKDPDDTVSPGHAFSIDSTYRLRWIISTWDLGRVGVALKKGERMVKILDPSRASIQGYNDFDWCVFCDTPLSERSGLAGSGYRIRVYSIENPDIYDESAPFSITE